MPDFARINELTRKYADGDLTDAERDELLQLVGDAGMAGLEKRVTEGFLEEGLQILQEAARVRQDNKNALTYPADTVYEPSGKLKVFPHVRWRAYAGAAAVFLCLAAGLIFFLLRRQPTASDHQVAVSTDVPVIPPGTNKATLTLSNGSVIILDSKAPNGNIARQGNSMIVKLDSGRLAYQNAAGSSAAIVYNTVATPAGGQYIVQLGDGTKVYLNAQSSLYFPTAFDGAERRVAITGEAYFEVAKNPAKPFVVTVNQMSVTVLGTHFDIMAYSNEPNIETTLVEGSVKIGRGAEYATLVPGDQARLGRSLQVAHNINTEAAVAWTENMFIFSHADIKTVMQAVSRWYQVNIKFEGGISNQLITAQIGRDVYLSDFLKILTASKYCHFRMENDNTLVVLP